MGCRSSEFTVCMFLLLFALCVPQKLLRCDRKLATKSSRRKSGTLGLGTQRSGDCVLFGGQEVSSGRKWLCPSRSRKFEGKRQSKRVATKVTLSPNMSGCE